MQSRLEGSCTTELCPPPLLMSWFWNSRPFLRFFWLSGKKPYHCPRLLQSLSVKDACTTSVLLRFSKEFRGGWQCGTKEENEIPSWAYNKLVRQIRAEDLPKALCSELAWHIGLHCSHLGEQTLNTSQFCFPLCLFSKSFCLLNCAELEGAGLFNI